MTSALRLFPDAVAASDVAAAERLLDGSTGLATDSLKVGATRAESVEHFISPLGCYAYAGDTALHFAAAAYEAELIRRLVAAGAVSGRAIGGARRPCTTPRWAIRRRRGGIPRRRRARSRR